MAWAQWVINIHLGTTVLFSMMCKTHKNEFIDIVFLKHGLNGGKSASYRHRREKSCCLSIYGIGIWEKNTEGEERKKGRKPHDSWGIKPSKHKKYKLPLPTCRCSPFHWISSVVCLCCWSLHSDWSDAVDSFSPTVTLTKVLAVIQITG